MKFFVIAERNLPVRVSGHSFDDMRYSARDHRSSQLCLS